MPSSETRETIFRPVLERVDALVNAEITRAVVDALRAIASRLELETPTLTRRGLSMRGKARKPRAASPPRAAAAPVRRGKGQASAAKLRALEIARARLAEKRAALAKARAEAGGT